MKRKITEKACAKINLYLDVGEKKDNGYHEICTLMQQISLCDTLTFSVSPSQNSRVELSVKGPQADYLYCNSENLIVKAATAFFADSEETLDVEISLEKVIPMMAGLGGGSSDAAATLRVLNRIVERPFPQEKLHAIASSLGSDVPFFLQKKAALCQGKGEIVKPCKGLCNKWILVIQGNEPSDTATAYQLLDRNRSFTSFQRQCLPDFSRFSVDYIFNSFEAIISEKCPSVPRHIQYLYEEGAEKAAMSGSGSAVFGVFANKKHAKTAMDHLVVKGCSVFLARML